MKKHDSLSGFETAENYCHETLTKLNIRVNFPYVHVHVLWCQYYVNIMADKECPQDLKGSVLHPCSSDYSTFDLSLTP